MSLTQFIAALTAIVTTAQAQPAPPTYTVPPPPMIRVPTPGVTQTFFVQIRQDGHILWSGDLQRSSNGTASYNQQQRESRACPPTDTRPSTFNNNTFVTTSLNLSLNADFANPDDVVRISVERTRPFGENAACGGEQGTSTVRFTSDAKLEKGRPATLAGEAGLSVTITRR